MQEYLVEALVFVIVGIFIYAVKMIKKYVFKEGILSESDLQTINNVVSLAILATEQEIGKTARKEGSLSEENKVAMKNKTMDNVVKLLGSKKVKELISKFSNDSQFFDHIQVHVESVLKELKENSDIIKKH